MQQIHIKKLATIALLTLALSACGSSKDAVVSALSSIPKVKTTPDLSKYQQAKGETKLTDLPQATFIYMTEMLMVFSNDDDYNGFGAGVFVYDGQHIDNEQAMTNPEACLLASENEKNTSVFKGQWFDISDVKEITEDDDINYEGIQVDLASSIYSQIFLQNNTVKDLTEKCFANKIKIYVPKK